MTTEPELQPLASGKSYRVGVALSELEGSREKSYFGYARPGLHRQYYIASNKTKLFDRDSNNRPILYYININIDKLLCQYDAAKALLQSIQDEQRLFEHLEKRQDVFGLCNHRIFNIQVQHAIDWIHESAKALVAVIDGQQAYMESLEAYWLHGTPFESQYWRDKKACSYTAGKTVEEARQLIAASNTNQTNN